MDSLPPFELLKKISNKFPLIWDVLGEYAKNPEWDERCYVPIGLAMGIFPDFHQVDWEHQLRRMYYAIQFSALAVWRLDKEVYQFSEELEDMLFEQSKSDDMDIPGNVLEYLPYRAFYVRFSSPQVDGNVKFDGFFVHYEWDIQRGGELCIRFLFLTDGLDVSGSEIKLCARTLAENFVIFSRLVEKNVEKFNNKENDIRKPSKFNYINASKDMIKKALELTLYICAQNADITASPKQATYRPKNGKIMDRYAEVRTWDVGVRIGAKVRLAHGNSRSSRESSHGSHASPRTHMRRGHWHHYWTGPRDGDRKLILKWTAPMLIGGVGENSPAVIHKVSSETEVKNKK